MNDYLRDSIYSAWHAAIPQLTYILMFSELLITEMELTQENSQSIKKIQSNCNQVRSNCWQVVVDTLEKHQPDIKGKKEFLTQFSAIWDDGSQSLNNILKEITTLQERNIDVIEIKSYCYRAIDDWQRLADYVNLCLDFEKVWIWKPISFSEKISQVKDYLQVHYGTDNARHEIPDNLPLLRGNDWLKTAIVNAVSSGLSGVSDQCLNLVDYSHLSYERCEEVLPSVKVTYDKSSFILVEIFTGIAVNLDKPLELRLTPDLHWPGERLSLVGFILSKFDNQAKFYWSSQGSKFQFKLQLIG